MTRIVAVLIKMQTDDKTKYDTFFNTQKQKQLSMKVTLMMQFNQCALKLYQIYKISLGKGLG